ncbi:MAG: ATP-binding cassette domain-containing protein [Acholeplasmataceae bacterium]|nr:ATP-binding cassette domain-containing protein [Acholeplasmataceae bacterium]
MLILKNITKIFNKDLTPDLKKVALNNINLTIDEGDFVTVIGSNGSGKSTFLNIIAGTYFADEGEITLAGHNITNLNEYKRAKYLGRVFQDPLVGTCKDLSLIENLYIASRKKYKKRLKWAFSKKTDSYFKELVTKLNLDLGNKLKQKVSVLSGGQRQAITLLMAIMEKPKLLLLDEHTAALDPKTSETVLTITNDLVTKEKITTIMITHNMQDALTYGNRLIMFKEGEIILDAKKEEKEQLTIFDLLKKFENVVD